MAETLGTGEVAKRARRKGGAPAANSSDTPRRPQPPGRPWQPGQSGNPNGRPKRKPITDEMLRELAQQRGNTGRTNLQAMIRRLIALTLDNRTSARDTVALVQLIAAYCDGMPVQTVEVDVFDAARAEAERRGLDPERVASILDGLRARRSA